MPDLPKPPGVYPPPTWENFTSFPYNINDNYAFSISPTSGTGSYVTFTIEDTSETSNNVCSFLIPVPENYNIVVSSGFFSPASTIEGLCPDISQVSDVPYFQTHLTTGLPNQAENVWPLHHNAPAPSGMHWPAIYEDENDNTYLYWSMWSQTCISTVPQGDYGIVGNGGITNPDAIVGNPDGNCAEEYGGNYGDGAWIQAEMNAPSGGNIQIYGYSATGYYSNLYVYVSMDGTNWYWVNNNYITVSSNSPGWISLGLPYMGDFTWIAVCGYDTYDSVKLELDAVNVNSKYDPEVTILAYDESSSNYVNGIPISVDGTWVSSGSVISVESGDNQFQAPDSDSGGAFNCFFDGSNYYGNGADILIFGDEGITAYYNYIPSYTVTITAYDTFDQSYDIYPGLYVDGNCVGYGTATVTLSLGWHSVAMDESYGWLYLPEYSITDGTNWYNSGDSIPITADTTITGYYDMYG